MPFQEKVDLIPPYTGAKFYSALLKYVAEFSKCVILLTICNLNSFYSNIKVFIMSDGISV